MTTLFIALSSITFLYFFFALTRIFWLIFRAHVCAICASVFLTWVGLLAAYLAGRDVDPIVLALLMGGSIVGVMYKTQDMFLKKGWEYFWIFRWGIIVLGTAFFWSFLNERWWSVGIIAATGFIGALTVFPFAAKSTPGGATSSAKAAPDWQRAKRELEERMKHCCD